MPSPNSQPATNNARNGRLNPMRRGRPRPWRIFGAVGLACLCFSAGVIAAGFDDKGADPAAMPKVPAGFEISVFAKEPLVRQPCSMAFDSRGRLAVGMGPQYRNPKPETPGDSVVLVLDEDEDGRADRTKVFATGFNAIQGLAWHGRELWVANAPDLTVVRDLDGDDEADEYVLVYTDLGNLEHGLHGLNWAPDGKLYMSKGNSKGLTQPGRVAPKPFRDLWGVTAPVGSPDFPAPRKFKKGEYRKAYHDPDDDWGREGGVLRCDDGGGNLEIVSRGFRNPWDITFDTGFNWIGTDNDQTTGDRVFMPFFGAHFGWNHPWSAHWGVEAHAPSAPVSGPLFEGSGTGVVFGDSPVFPASHRGVFFINDWLRKVTFVWRPQWDGALLRPAGGGWEPFVTGGDALFRPTDLEFGPDGALWILGWSTGYGAEYKDGRMTSEGRVFRVTAKGAASGQKRGPKRSKPLGQWSVTELIEDFDGPLPVWRIDAQDELVRRGAVVKAELLALLERGDLGEARQTWTAWAVGRMSPEDRTIDDWLSARVAQAGVSENLRIQAVRILGFRTRQARVPRALPAVLLAQLRSPSARLRFEAIQALGQGRQASAVPTLLEALAIERDTTTYYAGWQTWRSLQSPAELRAALADARAGVRRAALLALLESNALREPDVTPLARDSDPGLRGVASAWLEKAGAGGETVVVRGRPLHAPQLEANAAAPEPRVGVVRNIRARSGARYGLAAGGLRAGAKPYVDRNYDLKEVPDAVRGMDFIRTSNNDDGSRGEGFLSFEAVVPVRVHVGLDARATAPTWLRERFQRSAVSIRADHWNFHLYSREFPAGRIELGGNTDDGQAGGKGNYIVVLEPLPLASPATLTGGDAALAALGQGDRDRGEWLFHAPAGAGCFNCHRLGDHGNGFGPDLAALGDRATARHIIQSILEPNAVITEGFNLQTVETADAEYSGILLEESGLSLTLGLATGQRQTIAKSRVTARRTARTSAMPAYDTVLTPQYVADLCAYLLAQKAGATGVARGADRPGRPGRSNVGAADSAASNPDPGGAAAVGVAAGASVVPIAWPQGDGFRVTELADRLVIAHSGQPVGEYVFRDERVLRPCFANVHAPGGVKVTRNHPPIPGVDAVDHDTMHPGLWLAFGDISGADFWRNKGRIEHVRFIEAPSVAKARLSFATECRLRTSDGRTLCFLTNRLVIEMRTNAWLITWDATFRSDDGEFSFGDQEEMGFGARVATAFTEKNGGQITSSRGLKTAKGTWGQAAEWCDYAGTVNGMPMGITLLTAPGNFRPSWWHNRDYGVFVANPFGRAAMKQGEKSVVTVKRGENFHLRFGAAVHAGEGFEPAEVYRVFSGAAVAAP